MRRLLPLTLFLACLSAAAPCLAQATGEPLPLGWPADAQSTTGPFAPLAAIEAEAAPSAIESPALISGVPAYLWTHGCGPTALAMVVGYWDGGGFGNLIPGSASTQTSAVSAAIASSGNYSDYCLPKDSYPNLLKDKSEPPVGDEHPDDSIADFMLTSRSFNSNYYGWSWYTDIARSFRGYANLTAPECGTMTLNAYWGSALWARYRAEIDAGRPVVLLVDSDSNGSTDHFVTAIGYGTSGGANMYAAYNTWDRNVHWYGFQQMASGRPFGIYGATFADIARPQDQAKLAKRSLHNASVDIRNAAVSRAFSGYFYIQDDDSACGIRVNKSSHGLVDGDRASIYGSVLTTSAGERYISATTVTRAGSAMVSPIGMGNKAIGGADWLFNSEIGCGQRGVVDPHGPNNIGMLVRTTGRVTYSKSGVLYIDDGSGLLDGSGNRGVRVSASGLALPPIDSFVRVTGISTCYAGSDTRLRRQLLVRHQSDIAILEP